MNKIKINVKAIRDNLKKISGVVQFVIKSNAYGFGNELISYVEDLVNSVVTTDYYLHMRNSFKILNKIDNYEKCYMRIDPYLGLHGFVEIRGNIRFDKFLLHINEFLEPSELKLFNFILCFIQKNGFRISVGGSAILDIIYDVGNRQKKTK